VGQELISFIVNRVGVVVFLCAVVAGVYVLVNRGPGAVGKVVVVAILVLIVVQCMLGNITPDEAVRKGGEQFDPTQLPQEGAKLAQEMAQKERNTCLGRVARKQQLGHLMPNCAGKTGSDFETCMKQKVFGEDTGAWAMAHKECYIGAGQTEIDSVVKGYAKALIRAVLFCPYSELELCTDKGASAEKPKTTPYQQCLMEAVTKINLGPASQACASASTPAVWETCMQNVLCPSAQQKSLGCAWVSSCKNR